MKIMLIQPPWSFIYGRFKSAAKIGCVSAPLGLCYLGAVLKKNHFEVEILDSEALNLSMEKIVQNVREKKPDLIGITVTTPIYHIVKLLCFELKKALNIPIVVGGVHPTIVQEEILEDCQEIDYLVVGEGEWTLLELVQNLSQSQQFHKIRGLIWRDGNVIVKNSIRPYYKDLDQLPFPQRDLLDLNLYKHSLPNKGIIQYADLFTGRGCPFQCIFCSQHTMYGRQVRYRSVQNVIEELDQIVNQLKIGHVIVMDETLTLNPERIVNFCEVIKKEKLKFTWEGWTHVSTVDEDLLKLMADAGLIKISFGIESGNQDILDKIKKNITLEQIRLAYRYAKKAKIETRGSVMLGHPYETKKTIQDTIDFTCSLNDCDQIFMGIATPYPGTELWDYATNGIGGMKLLTRDFSKYQRYGDPVIEVNDLKSKDLINYQRYGLFKFYSQPRRLFYNFMRAGFKAGMKNAFAFCKSLVKSHL